MTIPENGDVPNGGSGPARPAPAPTRRTGRMPARERLKRSGDFQHVYARRCCASDASIQLFGSLNRLPYSRLGLSVGRRVGGSVQRNRWKRLCREAYRCARPRLPLGIDWIAIPRAADPPPLDVLIDSMTKLAGVVHRKLDREARR